MKIDRRRQHYLPTPEQIRAGCREIQAGWSRRDERQRRGVERADEGVEIRVCRVQHLTGHAPPMIELFTPD